ncbi:hypothetical protein K9N68_37385 (plasmid) [Kovacikia minuta CCNUW1]|uniref:hypothetical protein n=1 Tax=Kovacikia minuta TaxID=2931930 RepID=UPI001CCF1FF8|nr:hypothetical protein [Kovacikia minuta]UBF29887.1 hypothetical protein K9N68_37385 [Kovacikia minuta CCNUW1]
MTKKKKRVRTLLLAAVLVNVLAAGTPKVVTAVQEGRVGRLGKFSEKAKIDNLASKIIEYMRSKNYRISTKPGEINIVYVEGMNKDGTLNDNTPNVFNDRRIVIEFDDRGTPQIIGNWEATINPGNYYYKNPMNPKGTANIVYGQFKNAWKVGIHGTSSPHEALVQCSPVTVNRGKVPGQVKSKDTGNFGINQHGGYNYPTDDINKASAGCLVGRTMSQHQQFMSIVKQDPRYKTNRGFAWDATIISGKTLYAEEN